MTENTKISPFTANLPTPFGGDEAPDLDEISTNRFQPHLILLHRTSKPVDDKKGEAGSFFVNDQELKPPVDLIFCYPYRIHAKKTVNKITILETFDLHSDIYKEIKAEKTNYNKGIDIKYGVSLLGYLPVLDLFLIYHPSNPSSREIGKFIGKVITPMDQRTKESDRLLPETNIFRLTSNWIIPDNNRPSFWKPAIDVLPMSHFNDQDITTPPNDKILEQIELFLAPTLVRDEEQEEGSDR